MWNMLTEPPRLRHDYSCTIMLRLTDRTVLDRTVLAVRL